MPPCQEKIPTKLGSVISEIIAKFGPPVSSIHARGPPCFSIGRADFSKLIARDDPRARHLE